MPPIVQVTKAVELKVLQQRETKEREHHQCRTTQLDESQVFGEHFTLKAVNVLQATQDSQKEVNAKLVEHPYEQDVEECTMISKNTKDAVEEVK